MNVRDKGNPNTLIQNRKSLTNVNFQYFKINFRFFRIATIAFGKRTVRLLLPFIILELNTCCNFIRTISDIDSLENEKNVIQKVALIVII